ncbi:MAG: hypothetical protein NTX87_00160, partial [Planctomycetota bacterium]|nr:hypothetical protein [Planctomycetota bacterium]
GGHAAAVQGKTVQPQRQAAGRPAHPAAPAAVVRQAAQSAFQAAAAAVLGATAPQVTEFVHNLGLAEPEIAPPAEPAAEHEESPAAAPAAETPSAHEAAHEVAAEGAREAVAEAALEPASAAADADAEEAAEEPAPEEPAAQAGPHDELAAHENRLVEALDTGRSALSRLDRCVTLVQDLARAGAWRVVAGLVSSRSPEHAKIDEARRAAREAQELLRSFQDQVHALRHEFGDRIEAPDLADFAEHFARSLVSGSPDEAHGHLAAESARAAYHDVRRVCARLQLDAIALRAKRAAARRLGRRAADG